MKILLVHPSPLMHAKVFLRLEPLGLERIARALDRGGHRLRLLDLQIFTQKDYFREIDLFRPEAVGFSLNYLANLPEVVDLAVRTRALLPGCFVFVGGHSASFVADDLLKHGGGGIDCVVKGEGEAVIPLLLERARDGQVDGIPGMVTPNGSGPPPFLIPSLDDHLPLRNILRKRKRYFIGEMDPCASIEFSRGCPWHCSFCSGWTFYGRSYRKVSPEAVIEDLAGIREPNAFIVDDVAFIDPEHAFSIGKEIEKRKIRKQYYLETRCDVFLRNREVFDYWKRLGLKYMFLGFEAVDEESLKLFRKGLNLNENFRALEIARKMGITVAVNLIVDPDWDESRFDLTRKWAESVPEIVHLTVNTPYPGTETWTTEPRRPTTRDYRLFDVQHAVLPPRLPLKRFYEELVKTQTVLYRKHLGYAALRQTLLLSFGLLLQGQTNFIKMLWKFNSVYDPKRLYEDHLRSAPYLMTPPPREPLKRDALYIHQPGRTAGPAFRPPSRVTSRKDSSFSPAGKDPE